MLMLGIGVVIGAVVAVLVIAYVFRNAGWMS